MKHFAPPGCILRTDGVVQLAPASLAFLQGHRQRLNDRLGNLFAAVGIFEVHASGVVLCYFA